MVILWENSIKICRIFSDPILINRNQYGMFEYYEDYEYYEHYDYYENYDYSDYFRIFWKLLKKKTTIDQSRIELGMLSNLSLKSLIFILSSSTRHDINNSEALVSEAFC